MKKSFKIGNAQIGDGHPTFVIAEIAQAHDGSLGTAHAYIDAVAQTGADAIKFQTHLAASESSPDESFRVNTFPQDSTRYDYWRRMEFTPEQWRGLARHAAEKSLVFLSTPFSHEAVNLLDSIGVPAWKIGSGEVSNVSLLKHVAETTKPVLLSTGMSGWSEIDNAVDTVRAYSDNLAIFQCTTAYPCPPEKIGLNAIKLIKDRYEHPVGLSDHSGTVYPSLAAVTLGASLIEVHTVFSKECFGPDVSSSVTTKELGRLVEGVRMIETAIGAPVDKDAIAEELSELKVLFGRSIYLRQGLPKGHVIAASDLILRKPGSGITQDQMEAVLGKKLRRSCPENQQLKFEDLE